MPTHKASPRHGKNGQRWKRWKEGPSLCALINILLGGLWCLPFTHFVLLHGSQVWNIVQTLGLMGLFQLIGAFFHSTHTPERFFSGKFDIFPHGHQIMHVSVSIATWLVIEALIQTAEFSLCEAETPLLQITPTCTSKTSMRRHSMEWILGVKIGT